MTQENDLFEINDHITTGQGVELDSLRFDVIKQAFGGLSYREAVDLFTEWNQRFLAGLIKGERKEGSTFQDVEAPGADGSPQ
jgi:hypothetical protein